MAHCNVIHIRVDGVSVRVYVYSGNVCFMMFDHESICECDISTILSLSHYFIICQAQMDSHHFCSHHIIVRLSASERLLIKCVVGRWFKQI